jgi:hypothetical protein
MSRHVSTIAKEFSLGDDGFDKLRELDCEQKENLVKFFVRKSSNLTKRGPQSYFSSGTERDLFASYFAQCKVHGNPKSLRGMQVRSLLSKFENDNFVLFFRNK